MRRVLGIAIAGALILAIGAQVAIAGGYGGGGSASTGTVTFSSNVATATGGALTLKGDVAAGVQPAVIIDNTNAQNTNKQILSVRTGGVEVFNVDQSGTLNVTPQAPNSQGSITLNGAGGGAISVATGALTVSTDGSGISTANVATTSLAVSGAATFASTKNVACVALTSATPSTATATVTTGTHCVCSEATTATNGIKCSVSGTTLTITGPNTVTDTVCYFCG